MQRQSVSRTSKGYIDFDMCMITSDPSLRFTSLGNGRMFVEGVWNVEDVFKPESSEANKYALRSIIQSDLLLVTAVLVAFCSVLTTNANSWSCFLAFLLEAFSCRTC